MDFELWKRHTFFFISHIQQIALKSHQSQGKVFIGCLESVEWNTGMEYWNRLHASSHAQRVCLLQE